MGAEAIKKLLEELDLDKMRFHIEDVNVDELFDNLNASYNLILSNHGKKFVTNLQASGLTIKTDKKRLLQVIDNLMSNSMKFIPEKTIISFFASVRLSICLHQSYK